MLFAAASCESIFEGERDCSTKIKLEFRKHRQALQSVNGNPVDAFASTVKTVRLFVYDIQNDELVVEQFADAQQLRSEAELGIGADNNNCLMPVDLQPGSYRIVVWCGLDQNDQNNAFALDPDARAEQYRTCNVKRSPQSGQPVNEQKYDALYHGAIAHVDVSGTGQIIPVELTKNTNDISVWVQHTTAAFGSGDYEVVYTDRNGTMRFDDNTVSGEQLEYRPHTVSMLDTETDYNGDRVEAGAMVAHLSTARLMANHKNEARLEVRNREGETVFSIPFIRYLLEMQTLTADEQYYLDCEDTYNCSFYLSGDGGLWTPSLIIINNWVKVPEQSGSIGAED